MVLSKPCICDLPWSSFIQIFRSVSRRNKGNNCPWLVSWGHMVPGRHDRSRLVPFFPGCPAWYRLQSPLPIDPQVTTPLIWVVYYTIQRINYLKTIRFHCIGSRTTCWVCEAELRQEAVEKGFPIAQHGIPWRRLYACTCFTKYTLPVSTFQVLDKSGVENEKKSSNSCLISVNYGHYLMNFYVGDRVELYATRTLDSSRR